MGEGRGDRRSCRECVLGQGEALPLSRWLFKTLGAQAVPSWPQAAPHGSTISVRPGVGEGSTAFCLLGHPWRPSAPLSAVSLPSVLAS